MKINRMVDAAIATNGIKNCLFLTSFFTFTFEFRKTKKMKGINERTNNNIFKILVINFLHSKRYLGDKIR